jgi:PHD/YefM family antitoxin component YafN of YafNO toxin-antitoxin module
VSRKLPELLNHVVIGNDRVVVERDGKVVAAIVSASAYELLVQMEARREALFDALDATQAAFADVPPEEVEREIDKALKRIRKETRASRVRRLKTPA